MERIDQTVNRMIPGKVNCAQALLSEFGQAFGLQEPMAMTLGRPLGGGMGATGNVCGFVSAAVLLLGLANAQTDEAGARQQTNAAVKALFDRLNAEHGTLLCKEVLGADMGTPEGQAQIAAQNLIAAHCPGFGRSVVKILQSLL